MTEETTRPRCQSCGRTNSAEQTFCGHCGTSLAVAAPVMPGGILGWNANAGKQPATRTGFIIKLVGSLVVVLVGVSVFSAYTRVGHATTSSYSPAAAASTGDGTFIVGRDMAPGTYRSAGSRAPMTCYWERLSGFSGALDDIIANSFADGPAIVTIRASDAGFITRNCQTWVRGS